MGKYHEMTILIVDDQAFLRNSLIKELVGLGFSEGRILQAEDGRDAFRHLIANQEDNLSQDIDLVLSDWNMPNMSGLELLKKVRTSNKSFKNIPFALVTTVSEKDQIIEALKYNLTGYLIKPVEHDNLKNLIEHCLGE